MYGSGGQNPNPNLVPAFNLSSGMSGLQLGSVAPIMGPGPSRGGGAPGPNPSGRPQLMAAPQPAPSGRPASKCSWLFLFLWITHYINCGLEKKKVFLFFL